MNNPLAVIIWNIVAATVAFVLVACASERIIDLFGIAERFQLWVTVGLGSVVWMVIFIPLSASKKN